MRLGPRARQIALLLHVTSSVGWVGAVIAFLALAVAGSSSGDDTVVRGAYVSMSLLVAWVIVPLALAALASGLVSSLGTQWGLFRHWWVLIKLVLTVLPIAVLLVQVGPIRRLAELAADPSASVAADPEALRPLNHAIGGLLVLLVVQVLGIFKPQGLTRYGWRKHHERSA